MGNDNEIIMGFDILPFSSPLSKRSPKFSCIIIKDGIILNEYSEISRRALLKLVKEIRPKYLATDNVFEITPDSKSLFHFVERLPLETKIVQVTGVPPHQTSLKILAKRHGITVHGKPDPLQSARISAQLASSGVGYSLECFSEQTEIKVTRGRKLGRGGQSANRYRRKIHSEIQQMTRHIENLLKQEDIDYDLDIRTSDYGYASARIVAYAPLPIIQGFIESKRGRDFRVLISPVRKRTEFLPLEPTPVPTDLQPKYFILGIDPGTTAAICLLTLNGTVHLLKSRKGLIRADIIRLVYQEGIPILVASDVPNVPHFVAKIASTVNAEIFTPPKPIPVADKQNLAREYTEHIKIGNAHERDALTAAVYAYRSILPKLRQIDRKIREEQLVLNRNHLKALVIKGIPMNEAIANLTHEEAEVVEVAAPQVISEQPLTQERYDNLLKKYNELDDQNKLFSEKIADLERFVEYLRFRESELLHDLDIIKRENYWKVKRDREIVKKQSELTKAQKAIDKLQKKNHNLRDKLELLRGVKRREIRGDMIAIKVIPQFTRESIEEYIKKVSPIKSGDIILFDDASGGGAQTACLLIDYGIRAIITDTSLSHLSEKEFIKAMIPLINAENVELQRVDEFAFISRKKFEHQFHKFMKKVREQARQVGEDHLIELVEQYRRKTESDRK
jgi:predicted RNase H-like nuclease (RuvC/YqgF family)